MVKKKIEVSPDITVVNKELTELFETYLKQKGLNAGFVLSIVLRKEDNADVSVHINNINGRELCASYQALEGVIRELYEKMEKAKKDS